MPFWGLHCEPSTEYEHTVKNDFHISAAVLDTASKRDEEEEGDLNQVMIESEGQNIVICNLSLKQNILQVPLDLKFEKGVHMKIVNEGPFHVHLSGYTFNKTSDICNGNASLSNGDVKTNASAKSPNKNKEEKISPNSKSESKLSKKKNKKGKEIMEDSKSKNDKGLLEKKKDVELNLKDLLDSVELEDEEDEEFVVEGSDEEEVDVEDEESEEDEESDDEEEMEEEEEEEKNSNESLLEQEEQQEEEKEDDDDDVFVESPPKRKRQLSPPSSAGRTPMTRVNKKAKKQEESPDLPKLSRKQEKKKKDGSSMSTPGSSDKSFEKKESVKGTPQSEPKKQIKQGGLVCEDLKIGNGPEAKLGRKVNVFYEGKLKSGKVFDKIKGGKGFDFKLGAGDVIKAWEIGVVGMKVGGKRKIVAPPNMAYGKKGFPPQIPENAFLTFEVELRSVS